VIAQGKTKSSIVSDKGINVDIRVIVKDEFPSAINYFTGSKEHNIRLRQIAKEKGYKLNEYGLWKNENRIKLRDEKELYKYLGMKYIEPEMREDMGEIELAISEKLPELVGISDVKGVVHVHTNYSDGKNSIEENIRFAKEKGYEYIVISDHSKAAYYANGVDEERIRKQWKEIDELNRMVKGIKIYKGIECDIMQDGSPDIDVSVLKDMDVVIGAIHSNLGMSEEAATKRMLSAINTGMFDIIAHPTGRLLQRREGYKLDHEKFRQTVTERGIVIEINSQPERLDYDWREVIKGKREGCKFVISVDAHAVNQIDYLRYGVGIARKGWLERNDVINCMSVNEFDKLIRKFKERRNNGR
ncbi:MAG TPA: PHP domain-containing protein, partial [Firmicutes bacterium]|nr:PHP domain-containing protein [Bacillota bacterium]